MVKVTVVPFTLTTPDALPFSELTVNVSVVTVEPFTYMEKVADTVVFTDMPVVPFDGLVEFMVSFSFTGSSPPPPDDDVVNDASLPYVITPLPCATIR